MYEEEELIEPTREEEEAMESEPPQHVGANEPLAELRAAPRTRACDRLTTFSHATTRGLNQTSF